MNIVKVMWGATPLQLVVRAVGSETVILDDGNHLHLCYTEAGNYTASWKMPNGNGFTAPTAYTAQKAMDDLYEIVHANAPKPEPVEVPDQADRDHADMLLEEARMEGRLEIAKYVGGIEVEKALKRQLTVQQEQWKVVRMLEAVIRAHYEEYGDDEEEASQ